MWLVGVVPLVACDPMPGSAPPFTDWQNDLHLIPSAAHGYFFCLRLDLAKLITAATRAFSGAHCIGSCEDRSGYVYCRVPH